MTDSKPVCRTDGGTSTNGTERLECPNCGRQVAVENPIRGGTFVVRCQSEDGDGDRCHCEMRSVSNSGGESADGR